MGWGAWFVLQQSDESRFTRECARRQLRCMPHRELLATAETLLSQWMDADQLLRQAVRRVAELETAAALRDAPPLQPPTPWHRQLAQQLLGQRPG